MSSLGALSAAWTAAEAALPIGWRLIGVIRRDRALRLLVAVTDQSLPDWCALAEDDARVLHDGWGDQPFQALMKLAVKLRGPATG